MPNGMARLLSQRASAESKPGSSGAREAAAAKKPWWRYWYRGTPNHVLQQTGGACRPCKGQGSSAPPAAEFGRWARSVVTINKL
jgi:hypothetical protein